MCSHERSLTGSTYDFYCRDALPTYARDTEDLLSFLSVRMKSDGTVNGDFYPTWTGILPSIFENGVIGVTFTAAGGEGLAPEGDAAAEAAAEEEREEGEEVDEDAEATATAPKKQRTEKLVELSKADLEKTAFLAEVVLRTTDSHRGVLIKNAETGLWAEDPQIIATLRGWSVTNVKAATAKAVEVVPLVAAALTMKVGEQSITLSLEASTIASFSIKKLQAVVSNVLSVLPKRQKAKPARFKTTRQIAADSAQRATKRTRANTYPFGG